MGVPCCQLQSVAVLHRTENSIKEMQASSQSPPPKAGLEESELPLLILGLLVCMAPAPAGIGTQVAVAPPCSQELKTSSGIRSAQAAFQLERTSSRHNLQLSMESNHPGGGMPAPEGQELKCWPFNFRLLCFLISGIGGVSKWKPWMARDRKTGQAYRKTKQKNNQRKKNNRKSCLNILSSQSGEQSQVPFLLHLFSLAME